MKVHNTNKLYFIVIRGSLYSNKTMFVTVAKRIRSNSLEKYDMRYKDIFSNDIYSTDEHNDLFVTYIQPVSTVCFGKYITKKKLNEILEAKKEYLIAYGE